MDPTNILSVTDPKKHKTKHQRMGSAAVVFDKFFYGHMWRNGVWVVFRGPSACLL